MFQCCIWLIIKMSSPPIGLDHCALYTVVLLPVPRHHLRGLVSTAHYLHHFLQLSSVPPISFSFSGNEKVSVSDPIEVLVDPNADLHTPQTGFNNIYK